MYVSKAHKLSAGMAGAAAMLMLATPATAERFTANAILFEDVTGDVRISTNSGDEMEVIIRQGKKYSRVGLSLEEGVVTVKGEPWREEEMRDCCNDRITRTFDARQDRKMSTGAPLDNPFFEDFPVIEVTMPRDGDVSFVDARIKLSMQPLDGALALDACYVYGETGDVEEAVIGVVDGSRLVVGDIAAGLELDVSGDADVLTGAAAIADVDIAGPGDVIIGDIDGMLDVSIAGSGNVRVSRLEGPLTVRIAGSGAVAVQSGRADRLKATIDGSGGVFFEGSVVSPDLRLFGSSEVHMGAVTGRINHVGGGAVFVDGEKVEK